MTVTEKTLLEREMSRPVPDLDLYVDPLDRPFEQHVNKLWDTSETSETGYPSDAYIKYFMCPDSGIDGEDDL